MSKEKKEGNPYVNLRFCNERTNRLMDRFDVIEKKIDIINELAETRATLNITKNRDWRLLTFSVIGSVISGLCVAGVLAWCSTII